MDLPSLAATALLVFTIVVGAIWVYARATDKYCEWFGHSDKSTGSDRTTDFPSEVFVCTRCGHTHSENEWAAQPPAPKIRKVACFLLLAVFGATALYFLITRN